MNLIINGKAFYIKEDMESLFEKAVLLSSRENCLEFYMKDDTDDKDFDAILFLDGNTGENETVFLKYLSSAILDSTTDFKRLFMSDMIVSFCDSIQKIDAQTVLKLKLDSNILEPVFIAKDKVLHTFFPNSNVKNNRPPRKNIMADMLSRSEIINNTNKSLKNINKPEETFSIPDEIPVPSPNVFTSKLSPSEKRSAITKALNITDDTELFLISGLKSILKIDKSTGESKLYSLLSLLDNPLLGLDSIDDILSLGILKDTISEAFKCVCCCDIRMAYPHFKNQQSTVVREINYVVDEDTLYIVFAPSEIALSNITLKEYSIKSYAESMVKWEKIKDKFESYGQHIFYIYKNEAPDCIAKCYDSDKIPEFIDLKTFCEQENISYNYNTDISRCFPMDHIYDFNRYKTDYVESIRSVSMKVINACDIMEIREEDEISTGYDKQNNICFYCSPKY